MTKIHFLNVGDGDCTIIEHKNGRMTMIDICNGNNNKDENNDSHNKKTNPITYLRNLQKLQYDEKGEIFRFILTHPDMDHLDGMQELFQNFEVLNLWDTHHGKNMDDEKWDSKGKYKQEDWEFYKKIRHSNKMPKVLHLFRGNSNGLWKEDGITIFSPSTELMSKVDNTENWNDISYILLLKVCRRKILFCGDSEHDAWMDILGGEDFEEQLEKYPQDYQDSKKVNITKLKDEAKTLSPIQSRREALKDIDILFAPHHGRKSGGDELNVYLKLLNPKLAVLGSAPSEHKNYDAFYNRNIPIITNDEAGNIVFNITPSKIQITCDNNRTLKDIFNSKSKPITRPKYVNAWRNTFKHFGQEVKFYQDKNGNLKAF